MNEHNLPSSKLHFTVIRNIENNLHKKLSRVIIIQKKQELILLQFRLSTGSCDFARIGEM